MAGGVFFRVWRPLTPEQLGSAGEATITGAEGTGAASTRAASAAICTAVALGTGRTASPGLAFGSGVSLLVAGVAWAGVVITGA